MRARDHRDAAAVLLPFVPRQTSRARLQAYALEAAALLKADRNAAIRRRTEVATLVDAPARAIRSGATARCHPHSRRRALRRAAAAELPQQAGFSTISFFADGMSCGGTIALTRLDAAYEIRVNWLTGRVEIVSRTPPPTDGRDAGFTIIEVLVALAIVAVASSRSDR